MGKKIRKEREWKIESRGGKGSNKETKEKNKELRLKYEEGEKEGNTCRRG